MNTIFLQLAFNGLVSGLLLALLAAGFNLIFNTTRVFHIAHGSFYVGGAYAFYAILQLFPNQSLFFVLLSALAALLIVMLVASMIEALIYQPLARKKSGQAITLISSMGVYLFMINGIALLFGNETKILELPLGGSIFLANVAIAPIQLVQLAVSLIFLAGVLFISKTRWFLGVRAMMSNESVASVLGVNTTMIRLLAISIGSALAAIAAILTLYDTGVDPQAGMAITLSAAVAVIIGGSLSLRGTILASVVIALLQTATAWFLSSQWKEGMTFVLLILVFFWRTEGIVSYKMRVEEQ
ncbi:MAG: branched-chain amino acid ABC transporter permease [bacterium]